MKKILIVLSILLCIGIVASASGVLGRSSFFAGSGGGGGDPPEELTGTRVIDDFGKIYFEPYGAMEAVGVGTRLYISSHCPADDAEAGESEVAIYDEDLSFIDSAQPVSLTVSFDYFFTFPGYQLDLYLIVGGERVDLVSFDIDGSPLLGPVALTDSATVDIPNKLAYTIDFLERTAVVTVNGIVARTVELPDGELTRPFGAHIWGRLYEEAEGTNYESLQFFDHVTYSYTLRES